MSGKWITKQQIGIYMQSKCKESKEIAAAKAGFSERSAYYIEGRSNEPATRKRHWKTRTDPFEGVWESELLPLLKAAPKLQACSLLDELQRRYPDKYPERLLRTLQRRVARWKAANGPEQEVIFRQNQPPGWQGISDFTDANELGITIRGEAFPHLLYHFRLPFSGWEYAQVIQGGESYSALAEGMQNVFWGLGGVPKTHRTDSLSAAYKNLPDKSKEEFTESYRELCVHYGTEPTRNNKGVSHENGAIESPHRHLKNRLDQALLLRGSRDFSSIDEYKAFVAGLIQDRNRRIEKDVAEERGFLSPLPERKTREYTEERVRVTSSCTISVKQIIYSVPSRLKGMMVKVHLYDDRLECFVGGDLVFKRDRMRRNKARRHDIDYRHVVGSLVRKPQAFRHYVYRESMYPTFAFRQAWEILDKKLDERQACREYVKILYEAAREEPDAEKRVNEYLESCLASQTIPTSDGAKRLFKTPLSEMPSLAESTVELGDYDALLIGQGGVQ